jgi:hypothetical protein
MSLFPDLEPKKYLITYKVSHDGSVGTMSMWGVSEQNARDKFGESSNCKIIKITEVRE